jgi:hypothetical protein
MIENSVSALQYPQQITARIATTLHQIAMKSRCSPNWLFRKYVQVVKLTSRGLSTSRLAMMARVGWEVEVLAGNSPFCGDGEKTTSGESTSQLSSEIHVFQYYNFFWASRRTTHLSVKSFRQHRSPRKRVKVFLSPVSWYCESLAPPTPAKSSKVCEPEDHNGG